MVKERREEGLTMVLHSSQSISGVAFVWLMVTNHRWKLDMAKKTMEKVCPLSEFGATGYCIDRVGVSMWATGTTGFFFHSNKKLNQSKNLKVEIHYPCALS